MDSNLGLSITEIVAAVGAEIIAPDALQAVRTNAGIELELRMSGVYTATEIDAVVRDLRRIKQALNDKMAERQRLRESRESIEQELAGLGLKMEPALDSIAGGIDCLMDMATNEMVEQPDDRAARLAMEWTVVNQGHANGMMLTPSEYGYLVGRGHCLLLAGADVITIESAMQAARNGCDSSVESA